MRPLFVSDTNWPQYKTAATTCGLSGERSVGSDRFPGGAAVSALRGAGETGAEAGCLAGHGAEDGVAGEGAGLRADPPAQLQQHLHRPRASDIPSDNSCKDVLSLGQVDFGTFCCNVMVVAFSSRARILGKV